MSPHIAFKSVVKLFILYQLEISKSRLYAIAITGMWNPMKRVESPLRYPGGKAKALPKILRLIPNHLSEYREPFLGGGSVFVAVKQLHPNATYKLNDLNHDLYCFWSIVQRNADELIDEVLRIRNRWKDGRELYARFARSARPRYTDDFHRAVRFYILNRITYSGTVDSGGYSAEAFEKRFNLSCIEKLRPFSNLLRGVEITNKSYENLLFKKGKDVFLYLDPPYWKSRKSELYGRNGDLHKFFNHGLFAENVTKCKHKWLITCDDSDIMRELFAFANICPWELQYGMTNVGRTNASKGKELFVANYEIGQYLEPVQNIVNSFSQNGTIPSVA